MRIRRSFTYYLACLALAPIASAQSLVAYWDFENNTLDQAPSGAVSDNAVWIGTPSFTETSPLGDGLLLDGSNSLSVPSSADLTASAGSNFSISGWFRVDQWDTATQTIVSKGPAPSYAIQRSGSTASLQYFDNANNPSNGSVDDGVWHHFIAITSTTETSEIYIDGVATSSGAASNIVDAGAALIIGDNPAVANRGWKGGIDDLGIFQDDLTPPQAMAIYTLGKDERFRYRLPEVLQLLAMHAGGVGADPVLLDDNTWIYATSDPGGESTFVRLGLGADVSGITLSPGPAVSDFGAQPNFIASGNPSTLSWAIEPPFTSVSISPAVGDVTGATNALGQGDVVVNPTETTTYTITATNALGSNLQRTTIFVGLDPLAPRINEFVARQAPDGEVDENGETQDWIEIYNPGATSVDLGTYYLTDDDQDLMKWSIPSFTLPAGGYIRIFASGLTLPNDDPAFYHAPFSLSGDGEFLALTRNAAGGGVEVLNEFRPEYPSQMAGSSYGYSTDASKLGFLEVPTPGAENGTPFDGFVADTSFSELRGFFTAAFDVAITTDTPGATIKYTTDGSTPTEANGMTYTGPINISSTTILRAFAFKAGLSPTNVDTQSYFFPEDIRTQYASGVAPPGWPNTTVNGQVFNYGMDPNVTGGVGPQNMIDALTAIPTISVATDIDNLVDSATGIYTHANNRGRAWERPASMELVDPNGESVEEFQIDCGIRIRGGFSRTGNNPKHAFRFFFRKEYGDSKLEYPLFGTEGVTSFDKFDLRTSQNYSWSFQGSNQNTFLREILGRDLQSQYGQPYTRSRYYHLYLNGVYWGLFMTQERADADFGDSYLGGDDAEFDTVKSAGASGAYNTEATDGSIVLSTSDWGRLFNLSQTQRNSPTLARYMQMQGLNPDGTRNESFPVLLDVDNLIIYTLMIGYTGNYDAPLSDFIGASNNWFAVRNFVDDDRGFSFFVHDGEHSMGANQANKWNGANDRINTNNGAGSRNNYNKFNPAFLHMNLADSTEEYRLRFADIAHASLFGDGALTADGVNATIDDRHATVTQVIDAEAARWGDSKREPPFRRANWNSAVNELRNIVSTRSEVFLGHLIQGGLYPEVAAPSFSTNQRRVSPGFPLFLDNQEGLIYYTLDGTDPRGSDGLPSPTAFSVNGTPIVTPLIDTTTIWTFLDTGDDLLDSSIVQGNPAYNSSNWKHPDFDDSAWSSGNGPIGFGGVRGMTFGTTISSADRYTTYLRTEFNVTNLAGITELVANYQRDDGFIVYLNGQEIMRDNFAAGVAIEFDDGATTAAPEDATFEVALDPAFLQLGVNYLALELHNASEGSSDLGIDFQLFAKSLDRSDSILINSPSEVFSRTFATTDEGDVWSALNAGVFTIGQMPSSENLLITEVNYRPAALTPAELANVNVTDRDDFEFIELTNISSEILDLGGLALSERLNGLEIEGVRFTFPLGSIIAPRSSLLIVANRDAFPVRYPTVSGSKIAGDYGGNLSNGGEYITLEDRDGSIIASFRYGDRAPWPSQADGDGATLNLATIGPNPNYLDPANWQGGPLDGGTPGVSPPIPFVGSPNADNDNDGLPALVEYFTGTSDLSGRSIELPEATIVEVGGVDYAGIIFRRDPTVINVSFAVQSSTTMEGVWDETPVMDSSSLLPDGRTEFIYRQATPITDEQKNFLRLSVSQP